SLDRAIAVTGSLWACKLLTNRRIFRSHILIVLTSEPDSAKLLSDVMQTDRMALSCPGGKPGHSPLSRCQRYRGWEVLSGLKPPKTARVPSGATATPSTGGPLRTRDPPKRSHFPTALRQP